MEINQEHLKAEIDKLEAAYVMSTLELIKVPVYNKRIEEDLAVTKDKERIKNLKQMKENNETQGKGHKESLQNLEEIITEAKKLIK